ncbi:MAG: arsenate reductase ArsC [Glaciimonas sp.]|nr:arsenate reductase ArsC [Glaciimonas sp.]
MSDKIYNVLFLCTGNSARSIIAESILNQLGAGRFRAYSAGSHPRGEVHPLTLDLLQRHHYDVSTLRSKSWDEFAEPDAPKLDFVFTVCDQAAGEVCPFWPGQPMTAHWGFADPSQVEGDDATKHKAFNRTHLEITNRIRPLLSLPLDKLDRASLQKHLHEMGQSQSA